MAEIAIKLCEDGYIEAGYQGRLDELGVMIAYELCVAMIKGCDGEKLEVKDLDLFLETVRDVAMEILPVVKEQEESGNGVDKQESKIS